MVDGEKSKLHPVILICDHQSIGYALSGHYAKYGLKTEIIEPLKVNFTEQYDFPIKDYLDKWTKELVRVHRPKAGYRYRGVKFDIAVKKERKHKRVPRFLQRQRGEENFTLPFHRDEWGDVYLPRSSKLIDI